MPRSDPAAAACARFQNFEWRPIYLLAGFARPPIAVAIRRNPDSWRRAAPAPREPPETVRPGIPRRPAPIASRHVRGTLRARVAKAAPPPQAGPVRLYTSPL